MQFSGTVRERAGDTSSLSPEARGSNSNNAIKGGDSPIGHEAMMKRAEADKAKENIS